MTIRKHKDIEYEVHAPKQARRTHASFQEAAADALERAISTGNPVTLDVLVWSEAGAMHLAGDAGLEQYQEDPDASVFERVIVTARTQGRVA